MSETYRIPLKDITESALASLKLIGEDNGIAVTWDLAFIRDLHLFAAEDAVVNSLSQAIPGLISSQKKQDFLDEHLKVTRGTTFYRAVMNTLNESLIPMENMIFEKIGRPTFNLWCVELAPTHILLTDSGDFRVIQWESEHLDEDGYYVAEVTRGEEEDFLNQSITDGEQGFVV